MPRSYFDSFPEIVYNNFQVKDITASAALVNKYINIPYAYERFDLDEEQRPDHVAHGYYGDSYMSWIVFYANKAIDPYYDWFLSEEAFHNFLIKKYGSVEKTVKTILEFRPNWYDDNREISVSQFNSMFGEFSHPHSRYWNTNYTADGIVTSYTRKITDDVVNTNKLIKLRVSYDKLSAGDLIDIKSALNGAVIGIAEVTAVTVGFVYLKNVIGDIGLGNYLVKDSDNSVHVTVIEYTADYNTKLNTWTKVNISPEEYAYWSPYTIFEMEREKNDAKKNIKLVDARMALKIADNIEDELNGRKL